ncbi:MAG: Rab family GTPase [Candidatus Hermodarchaeota archaeon]
MSQIEVHMKLCLIGDQAVGKTSLGHRFVEKRFPTGYKATIGVDLLSRVITVPEGHFEVTLWDFSGQSLFSVVRTKFYKGAAGIVVVFDIANRNSFDNIQSWWEEACVNVESEVPIKAILLGNKSDLVNLREVEDDTAREWGMRNGLNYYSVSAKTGDKVELAFFDLIRSILKERYDQFLTIPEEAEK